MEEMQGARMAYNGAAASIIVITMPEHKHIITVEKPVSEVWEFMKDMNNWAPYMMGYISHEEINNSKSIWTLDASVIGLNRDFQMEVDIDEWEPGIKVGFSLQALTDPVKGKGIFEFYQHPENKEYSNIVLFLRLEGKGLVKFVVNMAIQPRLGPLAEKLLNEVGEEVRKD
jgi:uncharacterized membrane protein